ncbi:hypothetical protein A3K80_09185 [Candidatus Bathyarchaeota archaeon RBG_13_38_9]|nr:MAG: hypothetical protein A3K80_09185 [Candidatus Bathyarchaeota archaeon RBG_13_38_9]
MKLYVIKNNGALYPANEEAEEYFKRIKQGVVISCEMRRPRNYKNHLRYFKLLQIVLENQEIFTTIEQLKEAIKLMVGHVDYTRVLNKSTNEWELVEIPKSISFASMPELEFQDYFSKSIDAIIKYIIPGMDKDDLLNEVLRFS